MPSTRPVGSVADFSRYLTTGYWHDSGGFTHAFARASSGPTVITVNIAGLDAAGQRLARWAMEAWEGVANIDFREVTRGAQITIDDARAGAITAIRARTDHVTVDATINIGADFTQRNGTTIDSYSLFTYMHEIGHAMGLGHAGHYDGGAQYGRDEVFANDSWQMTVMSYFSQSANPNSGASSAVAVTPMAADIMAIQALYGATRGGATAGNTVYGVGGTLDTYFGQLLRQLAHGTNAIRQGRDFSFTLHDEGGRDRIDFGHDSKDQNVNLAPGAHSDVMGLRGNMIIAAGTVIEDYTAGAGNDRVLGNAVANVLSGGQGDDTLFGRAGNDRLLGGDGNDRLLGETGNDTLSGGAGGDVLLGGTGRDLLRGEGGDDTLMGGDGADSLWGGAGRDRLAGGAGDDLLWGDDGRDILLGGDGADSLFGGAGHDTLMGGAGDDRLSGGTGNDLLSGGAGADAFVFEAGGGADRITDFDPRHDRLLFEAALAGPGATAVADILARAAVIGGDTVIAFDDGTSVTLTGLTQPDLLAGAIGLL